MVVAVRARESGAVVSIVDTPTGGVYGNLSQGAFANGLGGAGFAASTLYGESYDMPGRDRWGLPIPRESLSFAGVQSGTATFKQQAHGGETSGERQAERGGWRGVELGGDGMGRVAPWES